VRSALSFRFTVMVAFTSPSPFPSLLSNSFLVSRSALILCSCCRFLSLKLIELPSFTWIAISHQVVYEMVHSVLIEKVTLYPNSMKVTDKCYPKPNALSHKPLHHLRWMSLWRRVIIKERVWSCLPLTKSSIPMQSGNHL